MAYTVKDLVLGSLQEIRAVAGGDIPSADDLALGVVLFNELLDSLNADRRAVYDDGFNTFTLTPNLQPHTIGLTANSPTFTVTGNRPESIELANIIITGNTRVELDIVDKDGWNAIKAGAAAGQTPTVFSQVPTTLYYETAWPNGQIFLWPVPSIAYGLELSYRVVLASMVATDTLSLPPGYREALRLTLAEKCAPAFDLDVSPLTALNARDARARVWANHDEIPRLSNDAAGISNGSVSSASRSNWNWLTGMVG